MIADLMAWPEPPSARVSVGIHPWYASIHELDGQLARLEKVVALPQVICIGECGLDRLRGPELHEQARVFEAQVHLAEQARKPLVIHCVRAHQEILQLFRRFRPTVPWVLHGVTQKWATARPFVEEGFYFSLGKALLSPHSAPSTWLPLLPPDRLLLETDDSGLDIAAVYAAASERLSCPLPALVHQIFTTFEAVCGTNALSSYKTV